MSRTAKPKVTTSLAEKELNKVEAQFEAFDTQVKELTQDRMNATAKKEETEQQTKLSTKEIASSKDVYIKPHRVISSREKFNEKYREDYNFMKEYVHFIAENNEIKGEVIELWTKPFAGMPAEEWKIPVNKPIWAPRYVAEQIKRKFYHRLKMDETKMTGTEGGNQFYGVMAADTTIQRLDARPVSSRKSVFLGVE